jgi:hypothetical protein
MKEENRMPLKAKIHVENQKKTAHGKLAARLAFLSEKGLGGGAIQRDSMMRKLRAEIRKANYRLACIAAQEKLNAERLAAKKGLQEMPPTEPIKEVPGKKGKKKKKEEPSPASEAQE